MLLSFETNSSSKQSKLLQVLYTTQHSPTLKHWNRSFPFQINDRWMKTTPSYLNFRPLAAAFTHSHTCVQLALCGPSAFLSAYPPPNLVLPYLSHDLRKNMMVGGWHCNPEICDSCKDFSSVRLLCEVILFCGAQWCERNATICL